MADVVATTSEPALGAIRLAWWRERVELMDQGGEAPAEPRLRAIQRQLVGRGIGGTELSKLEDGWLPLLEPFPWSGPQADALKLRGRLLFGIGARLLGGELADETGAVWSLIDAAHHCSDPASREFLLAEARRIELPRKIPHKLRPLTVLAALAATDARGRGQLARGVAALWHRLTGRFPR